MEKKSLKTEQKDGYESHFGNILIKIRNN